MVRLHVRVSPKSSRDEIRGWREAELDVRVCAPPEGGKANAATCRLVAKALGVPKSAVSVTRGETARHKTLQIEGRTQADVDRRLGSPAR